MAFDGEGNLYVLTRILPKGELTEPLALPRAFQPLPGPPVRMLRLSPGRVAVFGRAAAVPADVLVALGNLLDT